MDYDYSRALFLSVVKTQLQQSVKELKRNKHRYLTALVVKLCRLLAKAA